jgi:hypothetical protein
MDKVDAYLIETGKNEKLAPYVDLVQWSQNYDWGQRPFELFLDLIGESQEQFGLDLYDMSKKRLGYLELGYIGEALTAYADNPTAFDDWFSKLNELELQDENA